MLLFVHLYARALAPIRTRTYTYETLCAYFLFVLFFFFFFGFRWLKGFNRFPKLLLLRITSVHLSAAALVWFFETRGGLTCTHDERSAKKNEKKTPRKYIICNRVLRRGARNIFSGRRSVLAQRRPNVYCSEQFRF